MDAPLRSAAAAVALAIALALPGTAHGQTFSYGHGTVTVLLAQLSPSPTTYTRGPDFVHFHYSAFFADEPFALSETARLFDVGSTGCTAADFAGFVPGSIALVDRGGGCFFAVAYQHAQAAGASGVLFVNNTPELGPAPGAGTPEQTVPVFLLDQAVGNALRAQAGAGLPPAMTLSYAYVPTVVPEPVTLALTGAGLLLIAAVGARRRGSGSGA